MPIDTNIEPLMSRARPIGLKASHISLYTQVSTAALSQAINRQRNLDYLTEWRPVEQLISDCEKIVRRSNVVPDWKNAAIIKARLAELESERRDPPSLPTPTDWQLLALVNDRSKSPASIAQELNLTLSELSAKMTEAGKRFDYSANRILERNADIEALNEQNLASVDASEAKTNR